MKLVVPNQSEYGETRVALSPAVVKKLVGQGVDLFTESGAGFRSHFPDEAYREVGATVFDGDEGNQHLRDADVVVTITSPSIEQAQSLKSGAVLIGMLAPLKAHDLVKSLAQGQVTAFSMEFIPRISRAQAMDVLSSQANIGGYKAVLLAADCGAKIYPMLMTASGTIAPSKVFVIGAGVAGLQAIATAKRLGAVVEAFDVRPVVKEQVQSLGARFVELELDASDAEAADGYAKHQSQQQQEKQAELMAKHVITADAVITTAAVFGKDPPLLIGHDVVQKMQSGSVIVDVAADRDAGRGNCEDTRPDQRLVTDNGVRIIGETNLPALVPVHASQSYANNLNSFLKEIMIDGELRIDLKDEIQKGAAITHGGDVTNEMVAQVIGG